MREKGFPYACAFYQSQSEYLGAVQAGNILLDAIGAIKLGDFGVSACLFDTGDRQRTRNTFVGTPCWYKHRPYFQAQENIGLA